MFPSDFKCAATKGKVIGGHATEILVDCDQWHAVLVRKGSGLGLGSEKGSPICFVDLLEFLRRFGGGLEPNA